MFHSDKPARRPPPFGPPAPQGPPFAFRGPCSVPPPGQLPPGSRGPFSTSASDSRYLHNTPPRGHFIRPHCSSFAIDHSTVIGLGSSQQIILPAEPPHHQVPQWNPSPVKHHHSDSSDRAGEEFLRCIADNKPLPDYLKGNMAYNLADAFKSANVLKEAVRSDLQYQKHVTKRKSRSRSRGRSRGKSRGKSQVRSRSKGRSKSRVRGTSRARSKSRARSWSHGRGKKTSHVRSKSRARRSKSRSGSSENDDRGKGKKRKRSPVHSSSNVLTRNSLLEGLKIVMNSKEMDARLPTLKDAILTIKASDESKSVSCLSSAHACQQYDIKENSTLLENDSMLLPHDRVVSDFSWLQGESQDFSDQKADELEDEESFLYGNQSSSQIGGQDNLQEMAALGSQQLQQSQSLLSSFGDLLHLKQPLQIDSSTLASSSLEGIECEKIKKILKSLGASSDISETVKKEEEFSPALFSSDTAASLPLSAMSNPNVRQSLESLQSLIKATKEKRARGDGSHTSCDKQKPGNTEERKREKQAIISKMESMAKQLEELLKQDELGFLTPVIGFYCQNCEEFLGDLNSAERHAVVHRNSNSSSQSVQMDKHTKDRKGHTHHCSPTRNQNPQPSDSRNHRDYSHHTNSGDHWNSRDFQRNYKDERDYRSQRPNDDHLSNRAGQDNISLKEEMKRERMLITVSRGLTPPPLNIRVKDEANKEVNKEQAIKRQSKDKAEVADSKEKSSKDSQDKDRKEKAESSDSSDTDQGKSKSKQPKKKKKKKKEKKKKKKADKS
ncbi:uncharacterized protein si:ch211-195b21.5 [Acanthochromis polyacanthus]|uniref:uncharacterized protein si:ch211-195b21.5 n=1 Tax=Acanthochromis polyacanthus TaxID=80966 RepID=UPI0022343FBE|nr:uncharacterized protein si:ch211-195b21.5 [Acanthochromis polyacanthus]